MNVRKCLEELEEGDYSRIEPIRRKNGHTIEELRKHGVQKKHKTHRARRKEDNVYY